MIYCLLKNIIKSLILIKIFTPEQKEHGKVLLIHENMGHE